MAINKKRDVNTVLAWHVLDLILSTGEKLGGWGDELTILKEKNCLNNSYKNLRLQWKNSKFLKILLKKKKQRKSILGKDINIQHRDIRREGPWPCHLREALEPPRMMRSRTLEEAGRVSWCYQTSGVYDIQDKVSSDPLVGACIRAKQCSLPYGLRRSPGSMDWGPHRTNTLSVERRVWGRGETPQASQVCSIAATHYGDAVLGPRLVLRSSLLGCCDPGLPLGLADLALHLDSDEMESGPHPSAPRCQLWLSP